MHFGDWERVAWLAYKAEWLTANGSSRQSENSWMSSFEELARAMGQ